MSKCNRPSKVQNSVGGLKCGVKRRTASGAARTRLVGRRIFVVERRRIHGGEKFVHRLHQRLALGDGDELDERRESRQANRLAVELLPKLGDERDERAQSCCGRVCAGRVGQRLWRVGGR